MYAKFQWDPWGEPPVSEGFSRSLDITSFLVNMPVTLRTEGAINDTLIALSWNSVIDKDIVCSAKLIVLSFYLEITTDLQKNYKNITYS